METQGCTRPRTMELTSWTRAVFIKDDKFAKGAPVDIIGKERIQNFCPVADTRHSAVHHRTQDSISILHCLEAAQDFAHMHPDLVVSDHISTIEAKVLVTPTSLETQQEEVQGKAQERLSKN